MQILKYGICLESLQMSDLEMVRSWRNSEHVRPYMEYQTVITPEMQVNWFKTLEKSSNLYFVISKDGEKAGLINLKNINWETATAEAGIFIGNLSYIDTMLPVLATITLMEFAFEITSLKTLKAKIGKSNNRALLFNQSLGYTTTPDETGGDFSYFSTNKKMFLDAVGKLRLTLGKLNDRGYTIEMNPFEKKNFCRMGDEVAIPGLHLNIIG